MTYTRITHKLLQAHAAGDTVALSTNDPINVSSYLLILNVVINRFYRFRSMNAWVSNRLEGKM